METYEDKIQDQEQIDETLEPVEENLDEHEETDAEKWDKVFGKIDELTKRLDGFEEWVNEAIGGIDKTEADTAENITSEGESYDDDEVAELDKEFYERQKRYLDEGGY